ncbi:iron ABC transporter permease [Methanomassiliicoccales archaeon LGM-DZ1]|nr:iron ABC transporter permease [Methanomassiliicoccales archaeon LGM-DZ1]
MKGNGPADGAVGEPGGCEMMEAYARYTGRKVIFIAVCIVAIFCLFFVSLMYGTLDLSVRDVFNLFWDHLSGRTYDRIQENDEWFSDRILWEYRVPRALFCIIAGSSLAVAGAVMQSVMKNPLADAYTTGVSSGAMFGVAVAMVLGLSVGGGSTGGGVVINAMVFSMIPVIVMVAMAPFFKESPASLILAGVATSYLFNAMTTLILVTSDSADLQTVYRWQVGYLADIRMDSILPTFLTAAIGSAILIPLSRKLNLMAMSDNEAKALGVNVNLLRIVCLAVMSCMVATVVSYAGIIGFVGLVVPHIVRMVIGSDNRFALPASAVFGALFFLSCDIICRANYWGGETPTGVITSLVGAPIFMFLIVRSKKGMW